MLFKLLSQDENNVISNLSPAEYARFRKASVEAILGTDMTRHFSICSSFQSVIAKLNQGTYDKSNCEDKDVRNYPPVNKKYGCVADFEDSRARGRH